MTRHDGGAATAVRAGPFFATKLGLYAQQTGQTPRPVGADVFAKIAHIIMQLVVSKHLAAVIPSLLQQHGLTLILQRPMGKGFAQPCIKAGPMNQQQPAHGPDRKDQPVLSNEGIPHLLPHSRAFSMPCQATDPQTLGHLAHRVIPIFDLRDGIAFALFCEFSSEHIAILASKITKQDVCNSRGYSSCLNDILYFI
jgi:hypothetical protein